MIVDFQYAYLILNVPFAIAWILFFIFSKKTRREQVIMSLLLMPVGTITEIFYFQDYWNPASIISFNIGPVRILLEDFLFSFFLAGIGAVIYEAIFCKGLLKIKRNIRNLISIPFIIIIAVSVAYILYVFKVNSIFYTSFGAIVAALLVVNQRKDLLINSLLSGIAVMFIMSISYVILFNLTANLEELMHEGWFLHKTSLDIRFFNIPLTEMVWGFAWGMLIGPLYEFVKGMRAKKR